MMFAHRHHPQHEATIREGMRSECGTASVEFVVVAPLLAALLLLVAGLGRIADAHGRVEGAAREAARAASLQRLPSEADAAGRTAARASLARQDVTCAALSVTIDARDYRPGGQVSATVRCTARLAGLAFVGFAGTYTATATAVAPIEIWRGLR
jgi:Flp pilus assembly protein TadG